MPWMPCSPVSPFDPCAPVSPFAPCAPGPPGAPATPATPEAPVGPFWFQPIAFSPFLHFGFAESTTRMAPVFVAKHALIVPLAAGIAATANAPPVRATASAVAAVTFANVRRRRNGASMRDLHIGDISSIRTRAAPRLFPRGQTTFPLVRPNPLAHRVVRHVMRCCDRYTGLLFGVPRSPGTNICPHARRTGMSVEACTGGLGF